MARRRSSAQPPAESKEPPAGTTTSTWIVLIGFGIAARLLIAGVSWGTNDIASFYGFGQTVLQAGLFRAYHVIPDLNHPPIPVLWSAAAAWCTKSLGGELGLFSFLFKLPVIAADVFTVWLLYRIGSDRAGRNGGWRGASLAAWALALILVSGFHGNTDPIYAMLSLLAVWLLEDRKRPLLAGLALAAAINVKLIPVLLIPPLLLSLRSWRDAAGFLLGLSVGVIPFIPVLIGAGENFYRQAIAYSPKADRWGVMLPLLWNRDPPVDPAIDTAVAAYMTWGRYLILMLIGGWSVLARWRGNLDRYAVAAGAYAIFMVFTSGFGAQYVVVVVPLLLAARPMLGFAYATVSGICILLLYFHNWDGEVPLASMVLGYLPPGSAIFGLIAWLLLVAYLVMATRAMVTAPKLIESAPAPSPGSPGKD